MRASISSGGRMRVRKVFEWNVRCCKCRTPSPISRSILSAKPVTASSCVILHSCLQYDGLCTRWLGKQNTHAHAHRVDVGLRRLDPSSTISPPVSDNRHSFIHALPPLSLVPRLVSRLPRPSNIHCNSFSAFAFAFSHHPVSPPGPVFNPGPSSLSLSPPSSLFVSV